MTSEGSDKPVHLLISTLPKCPYMFVNSIFYIENRISTCPAALGSCHSEWTSGVFQPCCLAKLLYSKSRL